MNERDLGQTLLNLDMAGDDPRHMVRVVLDKDRRRVRLLTWLAVGGWTLAMVLILVEMVNFALLFPRHALLRMEFEAGKYAPAEMEKLQTAYMEDYQIASFGVTLSLLALLPAALCTVLLVFATRRATLRQVNANLIQIGEELKQLRLTLARPA